MEGFCFLMLFTCVTRSLNNSRALVSLCVGVLFCCFFGHGWSDVFPDADVRKHRFPTFPDKDRMNGGSLHLAIVFNVLMISFVFY